MKFTVDRKTWLRGEKTNSYLLRPVDGKKCCVGFFALAEKKFTKTHLKGKFDYGDISKVDRDPFAGIYCINDDPGITDKKRERLLKKKFAELGHEVEFIN